jgi:hypothetical protein
LGLLGLLDLLDLLGLLGLLGPLGLLGSLMRLHNHKLWLSPQLRSRHQLPWKVSMGGGSPNVITVYLRQLTPYT